MRFDRNKQHLTPRMHLELTAYQSYHTNVKQQMGINMSVFFCVSLWLFISSGKMILAI